MPPEEARIHTVTHVAMATRFRISLIHADRPYACQAATAAFQELDQLEQRLSRFVEGGDVFRINRLAAGASTPVHPDTFDCLRIAERIRCETGGVFDVAYASPAPDAAAKFRLDAARLSVCALVPGLQLDLGGIGKGFALDRMSALLADWDIDVALLAASTSTFLARGVPPGEPGWDLATGPDGRREPFTLAGGAISASGISVRGSHVVDPRSGQPASRRERVWAAAPTAAVADAISTALLVMSEPAVRQYCGRHPRVCAWLLDQPAGVMRKIGMDGKGTVAK